MSTFNGSTYCSHYTRAWLSGNQAALYLTSLQALTDPQKKKVQEDPLMPFFTSLWPWQPQKISKSGHSRVSRKSTFYTSQWPKKHFRVAESGFWGDFPQVLGGSLYWKVFSDFRFGDRKFRFRDVAIRAILRKFRPLRRIKRRFSHSDPNEIIQILHIPNRLVETISER